MPSTLGQSTRSSGRPRYVYQQHVNVIMNPDITQAETRQRVMLSSKDMLDRLAQLSAPTQSRDDDLDMVIDENIPWADPASTIRIVSPSTPRQRHEPQKRRQISPLNDGQPTPTAPQPSPKKTTRERERQNNRNGPGRPCHITKLVHPTCGGINSDTHQQHTHTPQ